MPSTPKAECSFRNYGMSAAVAYMLLLVTVVVCASFFNYVVLKQLRSSHA